MSVSDSSPLHVLLRQIRMRADISSAAIVIRAPNCSFAIESFSAMSDVCDISAAAREGCRAKKGLPVLLRLRTRAYEALMNAAHASPHGAIPPDDDDLSHIAGSTIFKRVGSSPRSDSSSSKGGSAVHALTPTDPVQEVSPSSPSGVSVILSEQPHLTPRHWGGHVGGHVATASAAKSPTASKFTHSANSAVGAVPDDFWAAQYPNLASLSFPSFDPNSLDFDTDDVMTSSGLASQFMPTTGYGNEVPYVPMDLDMSMAFGMEKNFLPHTDVVETRDDYAGPQDYEFDIDAFMDFVGGGHQTHG
jgi:hypothetical protein